MSPVYPLRQNKFVDRRIFVDLLARVRIATSLDEHVYISMGGETLEDHRVIHGVLGFKNLVSFDGQKHVTDRATFNRPVPAAKCVTATSRDLIDKLRPTLKGLGFSEGSPVVIWLDYTDPAKLGAQLSEFRALLDILEPFDIVRLTLNASPSALPADPQKSRKYQIRQRREVVRNRLGDYSPAQIRSSDLEKDRYPTLLGRAVAMVVQEAFPPGSEYTLLPLSCIRYADGQQMFTATGIVLPQRSRRFLKVTGFRSWPFYSKRWRDVYHLDVPFITPRERGVLDHYFENTPAEIAAKLLFQYEGDPVVTERTIEKYRDLYRFFPNFQHVWY